MHNADRWFIISTIRHEGVCLLFPKTYFDKDTCIACGACYSTCPDVYESDDDGYAFVKLEGGLEGFVEVPEEFLSDALDAKDGCPTESVKWED